MLHRSAMYRVVAAASFLFIALTSPQLAPAQNCLDYSQYLRWFNAVETPGWCERIALEGDLGYVANGSDDGDGGSISILDMVNLGSPRILSTLYTPGFAGDIDVEAGIICVADGLDGLTIVEAVDPANPSVIGRLQGIGFVECVAMAGSIAFAGSNVLYAVDLSSPASPSILDQIEAPGASQVVIDGDRAYVSCDYRGFRVYDIEDPRDLRLLGSFGVTCYETGLAVSLPYVYFAGVSYGFGVIDVTDPAVPVQVGWSPAPEYGRAVGVRPGRAYVADGMALTVIDIENPAAPALLGSVELYEYPYAVTLAGNYAFVPSGYAGVQMVDVEHDWPAEPLGELASSGYVEDVQASGGFAYLAEGSEGLTVVDLKNPAHPVVVGRTPLPNSGFARMVAVEGSRVGVIDSQDLLHIFDVSDPEAPVLQSSALLPDYASHLVLAGGWAYVPCGRNGLAMIDLNDTHPYTAVWIYDTPGWVGDVEVQGHLAFLMDTFGLQILDVTDPRTPHLVGEWRPGGGDISLDGGYACLSNGYGGLTLLDISDPANPTQVAECDVPSYTLTVTLSWPYVYSSNEAAGLVIHRVDDPSGFSVVGACKLPRNTGTIERDGDLVLISLWDHGLGVYRPQCGDAAAAPASGARDATATLRVRNPFLAPGAIHLELHRSCDVNLSIFDVTGRRLVTLANGSCPAGTADILWDGKDGQGNGVRPGIYFLSCRTKESVSTAKLTFLR